ncbi:MAG: phosphonate metabolism protein/1,5-bisphosphokinase (PRPP-forming) PhnN [Alphaproteobacteria bacterium]|nr:phosphonate metabolism protein/1,5-bisphosphokinase (PRPP-forming) PhnN [Alphaproteobacteria bacterium]
MAGPRMLVLIVGPSGAGKDTLLDAVRAALADDPRFVFARRCITRPADAGGEAHEALSEATFEARRAAGEFALWWRAHGLFYGIPADIERDLAAGHVVIASVSRSVIAQAASRYAVRVVEITAPKAVLAGRLAQRGREDASGISQRLSRQVELPEGVEAVRVMNDGSIEQGTARLLDAIRAVSG